MYEEKNVCSLILISYSNLKLIDRVDFQSKFADDVFVFNFDETSIKYFIAWKPTI